MPDATVFAAIEFAARAHAGQYRKGTRIPYIVHPLRVAQLLIECEAPGSVVVAGILHDVVEDTSATCLQISEMFGDRVAALVEAVTEHDQSAPWEERKRHTIEHVTTAADEVLLLVCADKLDNIGSMQQGERRLGPEFWQRFHRPKHQQAWYYTSIAEALVARAAHEPLSGLAGRLSRLVEDLFAEESPARRVQA